MTEDQAQDIAITALAWLAHTEDLLRTFLGSTGLRIEELRAGAGDPDMLAAILDFLLMNDDWIAAFSADTGVPAAAPLAARRMLPGGDLPNWT